MRHEVQPKNRLRVTLELVKGGVAQIGLDATTFYVLQRISDGLYWSEASLDWVGLVDVSNRLVGLGFPFSGVYEFEVPPASLDAALAAQGYRFVVSESTLKVTEHGHINVGPVIGGEWNELLGDHFPAPGSNTTGDALARMLKLRQDNVRIVYDTWAADGKPTHGFVFIYASKSALEADIAPWPGALAFYEIDATYDGMFRLTEYTSTRES